jgi:hypothetical protein
MRIVFVSLLLALSTTLSAQQPGALSSQTGKLQSELIITILPAADLRTQIMSETGTFEHKSEITRGGPVAAVVRTKACEKDAAGACKVNADIVVYKPDGSVFHEAKNMDLPSGRAAVPLTFDAKATTGVYKVIAMVRDLTGRRFETVQREFGVK